MLPKFYTLEEAAYACSQLNLIGLTHTIKYIPVYCGGEFVNMYVVTLD